MKKSIKKVVTVCLAGILAMSAAACNAKGDLPKNLVADVEENKKVVNVFGPMEKSKPGVDNVSRTAFDKTISMAEDKLGLTVEYCTYTAENYQERTYDDVALDRVRNNMDDFYLLNPDCIQVLGEEGMLLDLSDLE